jgi:hypothetical protein
MKVEFLYFDGCPNHKRAFEILKGVLEEENLYTEIYSVNVNSEEKAKELQFLGSPTIRINGLDIDKESRSLTDFGVKCRIYVIEGKIMGVPSKEMIRDAIRDSNFY